MSGIFLSYSRADRQLAERVMRRLRGLGVEVWWDQDMPGVDWQDELLARASELSGVLVVWTPNSFASRHVKDEARLARESDKLINVVVGVQQPPFPYDAVNALPLDGWTGREPHDGWSRTVRTIETLLVAAGAAEPGALTGALAAREADIGRRSLLADEARTRLQEAQSREADAVEAAAKAEADFNRAEADIRSVVSQGLGLRVVDAARQELDAAQQTKIAAERALRTAKTGLSDAARALSKARAALEAAIDEHQTGSAAPEREPIPTEAPQSVPDEQDSKRARRLSVERAAPTAGAAPVPAKSRPGHVREANAIEPYVSVMGVARSASASRQAAVPPAEPPPSSAKHPIWRNRSVWIGAAVAAIAAGVGMWLVVPGVCERRGDIALNDHDYSAAFYLLTIGTLARNPETRSTAEFGLSVLYRLGEGVNKDSGKSLHLEQKAAEDGCMICMQDLGEMYDTGRGVPQDEALARYWYEVALAHGSIEAATWLAKHPA